MEESPLHCPNTVTVRRNPHRKARPTPSATRPQNSQTTSTNIQTIPSFPMTDILSMEIAESAQPNPPSTSASITSSSSSENIKVFLRVRPLSSSKQGHSKTSNYAWPKNPAKKKTVKNKASEECLMVNDNHSVTLSPPQAFQVSKRIKAEIYQGFSFVFSPTSTQDEVYERMVSPLVEEFLRGKSGMLAALGPSGSGKTHTIFGTTRQPGMVPLALQRIFRVKTTSPSASQRSFYLSIFEIYSERGKGERMLDLSPDGAELCLQQSTIKGLKEVKISDATQAESLIACAMLKRATAMTDTNSQSSRSQCIISIHSVANKFDGEDHVHEKNCVLTIVDLAGAEREKRTGNQGARLLESNFINNTSMVLGLCLRSLLEHQKNPKKPLQKHFQNSLLTRFLRDYLEGKKRMTLILTVKSGEEDYLDASYLLRQASPYMKIKFDSSKDHSNLTSKKREFQTLSRIEQSKRTKYCDVEIAQEKSYTEKDQLPAKDVKIMSNSYETKECLPLETNSSDLAKKERSHQITQNFAKALWNVLKQSNGKLKVAESDIEMLRKNLNIEKTRNLELEKELRDLKSSCTCYKGNSVDSASAKVDTNLDSSKGLNSCVVVETEDVGDLDSRPSEQGSCLVKCESLPRLDKDVLYQNDEDVARSYEKTPECHHNSKKYDSMLRHDQDLLRQVSVDVCSPNVLASESNITLKQCNSPSKDHQDVYSQPESCIAIQCEDQKSENVSGSSNTEYKEADCTASENNSQNADIADSTVDLSQSSVMASTDSRSSNDLVRMQREEKEQASQGSSPSPSPKIVASTSGRAAALPLNSKPSSDSSRKPLNMEKQKRRLLPASSVLLRDLSALEIVDDLEKPKENRNGKKLAENEGKRTQGSIALLRLLKNNFHI